jgi:RNA polymerase sigma-70 factor (ECF subfamily)
MTDAELILASRRDPARFRELYDRLADDLLAYFYRRVLDPEVAADLLAETFATAFERRGRFRDRGKPGAAWVYGIAAKELSHWYRRQSVELRAVERLGMTVPALDDESIARQRGRGRAPRRRRGASGDGIDRLLRRRRLEPAATSPRSRSAASS